MSDLKGKKGGDAGDAEKAAAASINSEYESHPVQIPSGSGEHSLKANVTGAFSKVPVAHNLSVRVVTSAVEINLKLKAGGDPIPVSQGSPFGSQSIEFEDVLFDKIASNVDVVVVFS